MTSATARMCSAPTSAPAGPISRTASRSASRRRKRAASGIIVYNRKEGRALGEVTKFLVYNARKRQEGGDRADTYFRRTECVAGVQDMRFQELMPDVFHWLGIRRIDRWVSMSNIKHDALLGAGDRGGRAGADPRGAGAARRPGRDRGEKGGRLFRPGRRAEPRAVAPHQGPCASARDRALGALPAERRRGARALRASSLPRPSAARPGISGWCPSGSTMRSSRVVAVTRRRYPDLAVPFHSRWRHFAAGGVDRAALVAPGADRAETARARLDLAIVSVLLDAGAGPRWHYREAETGLVAGALRGAGGRQPAGDAGRAVLGRSGRAVARRCGGAGGDLGRAARPRVPASRRTIRSPGWRAGRRCCAGWARSSRGAAGAVRRPGAARQSLRFLAAAREPGCRRRRCCASCCARSGRSGPAGSALDGVPLGDCGRHSRGARRRASCRFTSSASGSPIR